MAKEPQHTANAEAHADTDVVVDAEPRGGKAPNKQGPLGFFIIELLAACVSPWTVWIELLPGADMMHEDANGCLQYLGNDIGNACLLSK